MSTKSFTVGITGGSGSGKTSFARRLVEIVGPDATLMPLDNYYYPIHKQPLDDLGRPNFDQPSSLDLLRYKQDLSALIQGNQVTIEEYTFNNPSLSPRKLVLKPTRIVVSEGLYVFYDKDIRSLFDLRIFIETQEDIKLSRRLQRDVAERGYQREDVLYCHSQHVMPSYKKYVEYHKNEAHLVVPNNSDFENALEILSTYLKVKLASEGTTLSMP